MIDLQSAENKETAVFFYGKKVHYFSLSAIRLEVFFNDLKLSEATGFIVTNHNDRYLVTNWHVLSGRCAICGQPLQRETAAIPNRIVAHFHSNALNGASGTQATYITATIPLSNENGTVWRQHRTGQLVDVACLKLGTIIDDVAIAPVNTNTKANESDIVVGSDLFILGYPGAIATPLSLPLWKRGTIATELLSEEGNVRQFLIDAATRPGMSGAPVFVKRRGGISIKDNTIYQNEEKFIFIGIYSGRTGKSDALGEVIGVGWPLGFINDVIFNSEQGSNEFFDTRSGTRVCWCHSN